MIKRRESGSSARGLGCLRVATKRGFRIGEIQVDVFHNFFCSRTSSSDQFKPVPLTLSGTVTDSASGANLTGAGFAVTDTHGSVQPNGMVTLGTRGSYSFTVLPQASRLGTDTNGRQYTIVVSTEDSAGNIGSATAVVTVPHDRGH